MKRPILATACVIAVLRLVTIDGAAQDSHFNKRTLITFSNAVERPGATLRPGTYLFRLADSQSDRHIVQVWSQGEKQVYATIMAVAAQRLEPSDETVATFGETAARSTPALQYWYYPGNRIGHEFVYPKSQALRIAQRTGQRVLSTEGQIGSSNSEVSSIDALGQVSKWPRESETPAPGQAQIQASSGVSDLKPTPTQQAAPADPEPQPSDVAIEQPAPAATTGQAEPSGTLARNHARELPRTASPLPLSALVGVLSLAGAASLRRRRR